MLGFLPSNQATRKAREPVMLKTCQETVCCPNCGSQAQRRYFISQEAAYRVCQGYQVVQTECDTCDYLMVFCSHNGAVVEAYSPGLDGHYCSNLAN